MTHRILTMLSLVLIAASCNMNSPEMAKRQIQKLEGQAKKINEKIGKSIKEFYPDRQEEFMRCWPTIIRKAIILKNQQSI